MNVVLQFFLLCVLFSTNLWGETAPVIWYTKGADKKVVLNIELFLSSTCTHCHKAATFFSDLAVKSTDLHIQRHLINEDKNALLRFNQLLSEQSLDDFSVPSIYFCNSRWLGFASAETTGKDLLHAINYCKKQIEKNGVLTPATVETLRHWANANKFNSGIVERPSAFKYILTIAFTDAFSPCAFFCFAGFLAFLWLDEHRKRQIIAGLLFLCAIGIAHYFQQVYTNGFYELLAKLRVPALLIGCLGIYFVIQCYKTRSNNTLYFLLSFLLGLMTTIYQQTCIMNWSYIFQQWLNNQHVSTLRISLYQLLYQIVYVFPLLLILMFHLILSRIGRIKELRSRFSSISLLVITGISCYLIIYPLALSYFSLSLLVILVLIVGGYFLNLT